MAEAKAEYIPFVFPVRMPDADSTLNASEWRKK